DELARDECKRILWMFLVIMIVQPVPVMFTYLAEYQDRKYWQSVGIPQSVYPFLVPLFALDEYIISVYSSIGVTVTCFGIFIYIRVSNQWLRAVYDRSLKSTDEESHVEYKTLQIFNTIMNDLYHNVTAFGMVTIFIHMVFCNCAAVRFFSAMPFPANLMFPLGSTIATWWSVSVFGAAGKNTDLSEEFIKTYGLTTSKEKKAFAASFRSISVDVSKMFPLKRSTIIGYLQEAVSYTITMLLTT
ncbi:unnamed protein product, partial [Allacma fusca]